MVPHSPHLLPYLSGSVVWPCSAGPGRVAARARVPSHTPHPWRGEQTVGYGGTGAGAALMVSSLPCPTLGRPTPPAPPSAARGCLPFFGTVKVAQFRGCRLGAGPSPRGAGPGLRQPRGPTIIAAGARLDIARRPIAVPLTSARSPDRPSRTGSVDAPLDARIVLLRPWFLAGGVLRPPGVPVPKGRDSTVGAEPRLPLPGVPVPNGPASTGGVLHTTAGVPPPGDPVPTGLGSTGVGSSALPGLGLDVGCTRHLGRTATGGRAGRGFPDPKPTRPPVSPRQPGHPNSSPPGPGPLRGYATFTG